MKKISSGLLTLLLILSLITSFLSCGKKKEKVHIKQRYTIVTITKLDGIPWFDRMRRGVEKFARETGYECFQLGPPKSDAALQVQLIEDMIAQGVDAICVVPFSVKALEPVLKKAQSLGIIVVAHEASNLDNADVIIEAFDNHAYGAHLMEYLARFMDYKGEYAVFVGSLSSRSHNEWVDGAIKCQQKKYPNMKLVTERIEEYDNQNIAYEKTKELIKAYPNLRGIQGSASSTASGAGLAVEEKGLQNKIMVVGSGLPSVCRQYLESEAIKVISFWDPADAGYVMNKIALMQLEGEKLTDGVDLNVKGYHRLRQDENKPNLFYGLAWMDVTLNNIDDFDL